MATRYDDLTQEQQAQVTARFTLGDPRAYVYGLGLSGDVLTRTPAPAEQTDRAAELETILRDLWAGAMIGTDGAGFVNVPPDVTARVVAALRK
jgi:hypothetical protein